MVVIRGAITVNENTKEEILEKTKQMLSEMIAKNNLAIEQILSVQFTATKDVDAAYPAVAARGLGLTDAALMCMQEMYVVGSIRQCIRCAVFYEGKQLQNKVAHVYLEGAKILRPDLT